MVYAWKRLPRLSDTNSTPVSDKLAARVTRTSILQTRHRAFMFLHTLLIVFLKIPVRAEISIHLSKAELDEESGNCVIQKVGVGGWMTVRDHWPLI